MDDADISNRFAYHPPASPEIGDLHSRVRAQCRDVGHILNEILPEGREKSLAITHLEEVMMWSNAAIARAPGRAVGSDR